MKKIVFGEMVCRWSQMSAVMLLLTFMACSQEKNAAPATNQQARAEQVAGRKNFGSRGMVFTPLPAVMIATYDANQNPDVMMAAWAVQSDYNKVVLNLSSHKTTDNIRLKQAFTISFATVKTLNESDYFGLVSGNDVPDKVARAGFTATPSPNVDAPIIDQYPLTLECRLYSFTETGDGGATIVGEVVNMSADESVLGENGRVDLEKLQPVVYDSSANIYRMVTDSVGQAWASGRIIQQR